MMIGGNKNECVMVDKFVCTKAEEGAYNYSIGNGAVKIFSTHKLSEEELTKEAEEYNDAIAYHVEFISKEVDKAILEDILAKKNNVKRNKNGTSD